MNRMRPHLAAFVSGLVFAVGLALGGMTDPRKVISFLDFTGAWDPSLALVMGGAIAVYAPAYRILVRRRTPAFDTGWHLPTRNDIDTRLLLGAALFGFGWGLGGFCPGPAVVATASLGRSTLVFTASMLVGMALFTAWQRAKEGADR